MKTYNLSIPATSFVDVNHTGDYVRVLESTATAGTLLLYTDGGEVSALIEKGQGVKTPKPFDGFRLENTAGAAVTVTVVVGIGEFIDGRLAGTVTTSPSPASGVTSTADFTATTTAAVCKAANTSRRAIVLAAAPANTADVKIGDSAITATRGITLQAGQSIVLETTAAIYARAASGSQVVEILEI